MIEAPIVAEVRAARMAFAAETKGDLHIAFEKARQIELIWPTWHYDPERGMDKLRARRPSAGPDAE
jgi:hypothetical protein